MSKVTISGQSQGGTELGYAETTANGTSASTTVGNDAWTGLTITVTVGSRPIILECGCSGASNNTANDGCQINLYEGATRLGGAFNTSGTAFKGSPLYCRVRLTPTVGSHTYKVMVNTVLGGTATFTGAVATSDAFSGPAWIQATEV